MVTSDDSNNEFSFNPLRTRLQGELIEPQDDGYDEARSVWNAMIDKHPAAIAKCSGVADVITAVNFARQNDILLSVKGGGHHVSGSAVCDGGLTIDLSTMNGIWVDPESKTALAQAGATWGEVDHETQQFGLATVGGQDPNIGVAGMTLGGGIGWLSRKYGLTIDNLLEAKVVTAEGTYVTANDNTNPELFWALRGGGGNFGVVTSFKFRLHEVGPDVLAGSLIYPVEDAPKVARYYRDFMEEAPRELRTLYGLLVLGEESYLPEQLHNRRVAIIISLYAGDPSDGYDALNPLREFGQPISDSITERPYTEFQRAGMSDEPYRVYLRSQYLERLSDEVIEMIVDYSKEAPSWGSTVFISHRGGAETEPTPEATAYPHRRDAFHVLIESRWDDPAADFENKEWVREFYRALAPHTFGGPAMNFLTYDESEDRVRSAYGDNYPRLVDVKHRWDPENLFRMNQNIKPSKSG